MRSLLKNNGIFNVTDEEIMATYDVYEGHGYYLFTTDLNSNVIFREDTCDDGEDNIFETDIDNIVSYAYEMLSELVEVSLVTIGKEGALVGSKGQVWQIPAEGGKPIDTTGAGDHFAAGFLYGQSVGATLEQSARIGSVIAGHIIEVVGAQIPDEQWEQIKLKVDRILA